MQTGEKNTTSIEEQMRSSYIDYAMSVIVGRALPDIKDGLKPVHRRILYAMHLLNSQWNKAFKKSARMVGDVIGKYHPHGETAVYDASVRMAQNFSTRYPLLEGQGNFGSTDGDPPAAMRYTEIRMAKLCEELLLDLDKETVDFVSNYDGSLIEPSILPAKYPNLIINGSSGIAVGMATNIPPHNLNEILEGVILLAKDPDTSLEKIMEIIPGPDFPTGGIIYKKEGIKSAYQTGRGSIQIRARAVIEENEKTGKETIAIYELPYQTNKARLIENIAELVKNKKIEGISDLRDESDRDGTRAVIEIKRGANAKIVLNQLYKHTSMQTTFGAIFLSVFDGQPVVMNLKDMLINFINFRKETVTKKTIFEQKKAKEREHILAGLNIALKNIEEIINTIKTSGSPKEAKEELKKKFIFSEIQAQSILDMRLQKLTGLERNKILNEYKEVLKLVDKLTKILSSESLVIDIIIKELEEIKKKYGDERRTEIKDDPGDISQEDIIAEEEMVVTISHTGYIKRTPTGLYKSQKRGGKGKTGMRMKDEDLIEHLFIATTHHYILFFTNQGRVYWLKVYQLPEGGRDSKGKAIINVVSMGPKEKAVAMLPLKEFQEGKYIIMATKRGIIKKSELLAYSRPRIGGIIAQTVDPGDELISAKLTDGEKEIFMGSKKGKAIRFKETEIKSAGRTARGMRGISLKEEDVLVSMEVVNNEATLLTVTEKGYGKRSKNSDYKIQKRGGKGTITNKINNQTGDIVGIKQVIDEDDLMLVTTNGKIIRIQAKNISIFHRTSRGAKLMGLKEGEKIKDIASLAETQEE